MTNSPMEFLTRLGWNDFFQNQAPAMSSENLIIARVVNEEKSFYRLQTGKDEIITSVLTGKMQYESRSRADLPAVGDWVLAEIPTGSTLAVIRFIFARKSLLKRKKVGEVSEVQILATNVDYVLIATSINNDLNFGRLERYLTFAWDSGALPVVLLTKADLSNDIEDILSSVKDRFPGVSVHSLSQEHFSEASFLEEYIGAGKTSVLVGSSGVGKSTLANFLIGEKVIHTQEARGDDDKGRHTTTSRNLYQSRFGGLIIDTPGMRELQFSTHEEGLEAQYGDIEELIKKCHFSNCQHQTETDCAIREALESGKLDSLRWRSFIKIQREIRHEVTKQSKWLTLQKRKEWKKRAVENRQKYKGWQ